MPDSGAWARFAVPDSGTWRGVATVAFDPPSIDVDGQSKQRSLHVRFLISMCLISSVFVVQIRPNYCRPPCADVPDLGAFKDT